VLYAEGELMTAWMLRLERVELEQEDSVQDSSSD